MAIGNRTVFLPILTLTVASLLSFRDWNLFSSNEGYDSEPSQGHDKKSVTEVFRDLTEKVAVSSATGSLFSGSPFRTYKDDHYFSPGWSSKVNGNAAPKSEMNKNKKWAVVTTISGPTEAVMLAAGLPGWCTVIVADNKTPNNYLDLANVTDNDEKCIHFLSVSKQEEWSQQGGMVGEFLRAIPYNHFARKNVGFLYAVQHGAEFIFDFDDDNLLTKDAHGKVIDPVENMTHLENVRIPIVGTTVFNHHKLMNASLPTSWPRGFPLEYVLVEETTGSVAFTKQAVPLAKIGVMQFCAQGDPDIDAVHRLTKPLPMTFDIDGFPLQVPAHAFTPYNAQATVHMYSSLWAILLPHTVPGRVSDIWRGYFATVLFRELDISLVFLPPKIRQDRNAHNYLADMRAELDLYFKSSKLIEFLNNEWSSPAESIPELMEELWISLYERGYIELDDVKVVQLWLKAMVEVGYKFPTLKRRRHNRVAVMGQFNFNSQPEFVIFWVQKWREWFRHVVVRGPFNQSTFSELRSHGISVYQGIDDRGRVSPMDNLKETLHEFKHDKGIDGVLYIHDDALLNISAFMNTHRESPDSIIGSLRVGVLPNSYKDHRFIDDVDSLSRTSYRILSDGSFAKADGQKFASNEVNELISTLMPWLFQQCIPQMANVAQSKLFQPYKEPDGSFTVPSPTQADMLLVPTRLADEYAHAAQILVDAQLFLECGFPTIVQMLQINANASAVTIPLCTGFGKFRGTEKMVESCLHGAAFVAFHPYKISRGLEEWDRMFDKVASV